MLRILAIFLALAMARPVAACETALLLAVDVSGSISAAEYSIQMEGLAAALQDPDIVTALVAGQDALALVQWSGDRYQKLSLPWQNLRTLADVADLAALIRTIPRPQNYTDTAIGNAIHYSTAQFGDVATCLRHVIDVSGDGEENDGMSLPAAKAEAEAAGIIVNGIAIEVDDGTTLTDYYARYVITETGFVMSARGVKDYPRAIDAKLLRELTKPVS